MYDDLGRLTSTAAYSDSENPEAASDVTEYLYDHDGLGRVSAVIELDDQGTAARGQAWAYTGDADTRPRRIETTDPDDPEDRYPTFDLTYDEVARLVGIVKRNEAGGGVQSWDVVSEWSEDGLADVSVAYGFNGTTQETSGFRFEYEAGRLRKASWREGGDDTYTIEYQYSCP